MRVLGVSCGYHDAAAAIVVDGEIVAAAEQERFTRTKHDRGVPAEAIASCLAVAGIRADEVDEIVYHEKPLVVLGRVLAVRQRRGVRGVGSFAAEFPALLGENLMVGYRIERVLRRLGARSVPKVKYGEHHLSHAAAAYYPSPFESAAILTVDGIGEWATASMARGTGAAIDQLAELRYPHSLGLLYSLGTAWCGFEPNDGEYKLMGLAPYGSPTYLDAIREIAHVHDDGSVTFDLAAIDGWAQPGPAHPLVRRFGGPPRPTGAEIGAREADLAASLQVFLEETLLAMARHLHGLTGERNLCLAGGVALNCVANSRLLSEGPFDEIWVQPAAGDAGSALGAALWFWHAEQRRPRTARPDAMANAALGPSFSDDEIRAWLAAEGVVSRELPADELATHVAARLADGAIVGRFDGPMEFGPRALGNRSILADPRSTTAQLDINLRVKGRESFRPFAPAVLWEHAAEWFEIEAPSRFMLFTHQVASRRRVEVGPEPDELAERVRVPRSEIPACTHIDGSARVQTVHREYTPSFHALIEAFHRATGCPVLLNTSFNVAGEPIVCTPQDALATARQAQLDVLVLGSHVVEVGGARS